MEANGMAIFNSIEMSKPGVTDIFCCLNGVDVVSLHLCTRKGLFFINFSSIYSLRLARDGGQQPGRASGGFELPWFL